MASPSTASRRTSLYAIHREIGGRLVDFHGWELPVQFSSILREHQAVRSNCGLFDVSHMGQVVVEGPQALDLIQKVNSNDASHLKPGEGMYSHMLNERGGVVDDVIVSRLGSERFFVVVNASTAHKDISWMRAHASGLRVEVQDRSAELGMLALQGPQAATVLRQVLPDAVSLPRFGVLESELYGHRLVVSRTGYTGEDGFELAAPDVILPRIWENLFTRGASFGLLPCGLGARDTLRLEAGYLLYGQDIDEEHTPLEANYGWVVKFGKKDFIGKSALEGQKRDGLSRRLYAVKLGEKGVPRPGAPVFLEGEEAGRMSFSSRPVSERRGVADEGRKEAGRLASATFSPTLQTGIGVGYLGRSDLHPGLPVQVEIHGRRVAAEIVTSPFYKRAST